MTDKQRKQITELRAFNKGYSEIASITGLSRDSVKAYCRNHNLGGVRKGNAADSSFCRNCGMPISSVAGKRTKIFCSDKCRHAWDNSHRNKTNLKSFHLEICEECGKSFEVYSTTKRKFCSHNCYINHRFGKCV